MGAVVQLPPKGTALLPVTEDSLALAFAAENEGRFRYEHHSGRWYTWTGARWRVVEKGESLEAVRELCRRYAVLEEGASSKLLGKTGTVHGVEKLARSDCRLAVVSNEFDRDDMILGTPEGTVDLVTGELRPSRLEELVTRSTSVAPAPAGTVPHRFLAFLRQCVSGDEDSVVFLQRYAGLCLSGLTREQVFLMIYGPGGNGKSVLQNILKRVMGDYAVTAAMSTFEASQHDKHPTSIAALQGARLVLASETEEGRHWAENRIKELTGGTAITARFMRKDEFEFLPRFKALFIGNHRPSLRVPDKAMRRRMMMLHFAFVPDEPDQNLENSLMLEAPAILRWMLDGCVDYLLHGLPRPSAVERETEDYFAEQDVVGQWIKALCSVEVSAPFSLRSLSSKLYGSWEGWCKNNGEEPGSNRRLSQELSRRGFSKVRGVHGTEFLGLSVRNQGVSDG